MDSARARRFAQILAAALGAGGVLCAEATGFFLDGLGPVGGQPVRMDRDVDLEPRRIRRAEYFDDAADRLRLARRLGRQLDEYYLARFGAPDSVGG